MLQSKINFFNMSRLTFIIILVIVLLSLNDNFAQKNKKIELTAIKFSGNTFFNENKLKELIISKESPGWFSQFLNSFSGLGNPAIYFDSLKIQDDIAIIENLYKANGFFKTKIYADYSIEANGEKEAKLNYIINENSRSIIRKHETSGLETINQNLLKSLNELNNIDSNTFYSEKLIEDNNKKTVNFLLDKGYILVDVSKPVVRVDTLYNVVDVLINFNLGKRYRISKVRVKKSGPGENLVSNELIKEIANINNEKYYNTSELKLSQIRLYRTNLFSSAVISGNVIDTIQNSIPVDIVTKIGLLHELSPEIIAVNEKNNFKFGLGLSFSKKNFLGNARKLTLSASAATQNLTEFLGQVSLATDNVYGYADTRIGLEQPFLFGKPINTLLEGYYTLEKREKQWNAAIYGANLNLNFELPPYTYITSLSTYFKWEHAKYIFQDEYLSEILPDSLEIKKVTTNSTNNILGIAIVIDKTNDLLFPTEGYALSLIAEDGNTLPYLFSLIGNYNFKSATYYKLLLTTTKFFPNVTLLDVLGLKLKIGNINTFRGSVYDIPFNQRFSAGGSNSIRGWRANSLPETENVLPANFTKRDIENIARNRTPGGFFLFEGSIEGRILLSENIGSAIFIDFGSIWDHYKLIRLNEIAVAAGFGFRYYSIFAPIRLDFGFKAYDPNDTNNFFYRIKHTPFFKNFIIQIGIGEAF
ncbi:MAG: hypothetical protein CR986_00455 [Ignavibacteriae bacterium]|nr:MAG: hypothetical protein CR986_00455 [Ignavibacteriota bacterium]